MTIGSNRALFLSFCLVLCAGNAAADEPMDFMALRDFAKGYAAAWSSHDPELLASFYSPEGAFIVNDGEPAVGRAAITEKARGAENDRS